MKKYKQDKNKEEILMFSGGKDSVVMLHLLITKYNWNGRIIHADTTLELPNHYEFLKWLEKNLKIKIEIVKSKQDPENWIKGKFVKGKNIGKIRGLPMRFGNMCFIRGTFKVNPIKKFIKSNKNNITLLGFTKDEIERSKQKEYNKNYRFPLIELNIKSEDCLKYLKKNKIPFPFMNRTRTGCYLCPQQNKKSLYLLWLEYPNLWQKLKNFDKLGENGFKENYLNNLEKDFKNNKIPK